MSHTIAKACSIAACVPALLANAAQSPITANSKLPEISWAASVASSRVAAVMLVVVLVMADGLVMVVVVVLVVNVLVLVVAVNVLVLVVAVNEVVDVVLMMVLVVVEMLVFKQRQVSNTSQGMSPK